MKRFLHEVGVDPELRVGRLHSLGTRLGMRGYEGRSSYFRICAASRTEKILHLSCLDGGDIRWEILSNLMGANRSRVAILGIGDDRNVSLCDRMTLKYDHRWSSDQRLD